MCKTAPPVGGAVDKNANLGYSKGTGVLPVGRLPHLVIRSNRDLGKFGGYFLFIIMHLENQRDNSDNDHTESK